MTVRQPRYNHDEFARRGDEIYQTQIRPQVEAGNHGKIVAIDIETLNLPWTGVDRGTLGDGSEAGFEVYAATVIWDGEYRNIPVNEAETEPLVGMSLLHGYDLHIRAIEGGNVTIKAIA